jgi:hypothetical protein
MLGSLIKKKLSDNQLANIFINGLFETIDNGFPEVAQLINEDVAFVKSPEIDPTNSGQFTLILLVGNLTLLESTFEPEQADRIEALIFEKLAVIYDMDKLKFEDLVRQYKSFIQRVNHPSKNVIYGMSKAIFHKYNLNNFQDEYFKRMQAPNPLFLKRMDDVVTSFIWNWDAFFKKYKIN